MFERSVGCTISFVATTTSSTTAAVGEKPTVDTRRPLASQVFDTKMTLRARINFIGNANKFCKSKVFISLKSDNDFTEITIEDDGDGYPSDILSKIGEPYLKSSDKNSGLGLGLFIGKTLLEKNFANVNCWNSQTRSGAEVTIKWKNKDLFNL